MEGCVACSSNVSCLTCLGNYTLSAFGCSAIKVSAAVYPSLKLISAYVNVTTLKHTLRVFGDTFAYSPINLMTSSNLSYVTPGGGVSNLTITGFLWGSDSQSIIFYSNNPFDFTSSSVLSPMKLLSVRLLQ
jgi:hypothetical protein